MKYLKVLFILLLVPLSFVACSQGKENSVNKNEVTLEEKGGNQQETPKNAEQALTDEETQNNASFPLDNYDTLEIEYARVLLMTDVIDPESPVIYVSHSFAGDPIADYSEGSVVYPEDVTHLSGEFVASGSITYASQKDGNITIYPVPSHYQQSDQSEEGYRQITQDVLDNRQTVYLDPSTDDLVADKIESVDFIISK